MRKLNKTAIITLLLTTLLIGMVPDVASASAGISSALINAVKLLCDEIVKFVAIFAIIASGVGAVTGRVQWGVVVIVIVGIVVMFSAPAIVSVITGKSAAVECK